MLGFGVKSSIEVKRLHCSELRLKLELLQIT